MIVMFVEWASVCDVELSRGVRQQRCLLSQRKYIRSLFKVYLCRGHPAIGEKMEVHRFDRFRTFVAHGEGCLDSVVAGGVHIHIQIVRLNGQVSTQAARSFRNRNRWTI